MDTVPGAFLGALARRCRDLGFLACLAGGAGLLAFFGFYFAGAGSDHARTWLTDFAYIPFDVMAVPLALRAARHPALDRRTRLAWRILAAAFGCQLFANTVWWWMEAVQGGSPPFPSLADVGYVAFIPVLLAGLLAFPVGDLVMLFGIAKVLLRGPAESSRRPLQILVVGLVLFVVADVYYGYVGLHDGFIGGSWPDLFWLSANYLFAVSAAEQHLRAEHPEGDVRRARSWHVNRLPYVGVALGYGLLLLIARGQRLYPLGGLLIGAIVLTVLVVLRQITALRENHALVVTDSLTGLTNRAQLRATLDRALLR